MSDLPIRLAAFDWLRARVSDRNEALPRTLLAEGFQWQGKRIALVGPQGIFKPQACEFPLSITTSPNSPYADSFSREDLLLYRYRGSDPSHRDNVGLRSAMAKRVPLIYLFGIVEGRYLPVWPVFIVADDPANLTFTVAVEEERREALMNADSSTAYRVAEDDGASRRAYLTAQTKVRVHQRSFRERVLRAYGEQCAFCRLKHQELLDAAHIIADSEPEGDPVISNGLALCKLHHAAFDSHFLGVTSDHMVIVRPDILKEPDGPMHQYGLRAMQGQRILLPLHKRDWPDPQLLQKRFEAFRGQCHQSGVRPVWT